MYRRGVQVKKEILKKIIKETQKTRKFYRLRPADIQYIIELANEHPKWPVNKIFDEALRPRIRTCLILELTPKIDKALQKAAKQYQLDLDYVICHVLEEWLKAKKMFDKE